ncbi:hypothetical protein JCM33374_g4764 [Metschnikowia sp. JCM 33374]|nr:hypothetical protein JCM33374_g4764 [Metschnikowia sp. JCM 33374]
MSYTDKTWIRAFRFQTSSSFHTHRVEFDACGYTLSPLFERSQSIKELTLLQHKVFNWARIKLPVGLTHLELRFKIDPDDYWDSHVVSGVFGPLSPSMPLKSLCISGSDMQTVNVSQLPRTLERLDLSGNHFRNFESEGKSPSWPVHIKSMNLGNNKSFDDSSMKQLSQIAWPPFLETLHLGSNEVTSLEYLSNLPRSLKCLDLSRTDIKTFRVEHNDDTYPFFRFPECLESLDLQARCMEFMRTTRIDAIPLKDRIQFPSNLKYLNLSWHNKTNIANYLFPSSLETLLMEFTDINDLTRYNYIVGTEEIVSWKHLINLKTLDLRENRLKTLENWCPPKSLQNLNLGVNEIKCLTASNTPLFNGNFSEYTNNIEVLDISASTIQDIDDNVVLPRNLRTLDLGENSMKNFVFTNEFANHQTLATLDMSSGNLEQISVESPGKSQSHLKSFSISFLSCTFRMSKEEFYKVFEQIGLVVTDKNQDIEGEHLFK